MCQTPITETNCKVIMIPKIIGTKSPMRLIDGVNNIGNANTINTIAMMAVMLIILGRSICAI